VLIRVLLGIRVVLVQMVTTALLVLVPLREVLADRVILAAMAIQEVLVLMVMLVLTATQEAQPLLLVTQII